MHAGSTDRTDTRSPIVAAPGNNISSAAVGTGTGSIQYTGTSMSAPFASGVAAQVLQAHQDYSPIQIKAAMMNSADHDLHDVDGHTYAVDRVGSGRIDAKAAVDTRVLLYNADRPEQVSQTSACWNMRQTQASSRSPAR